MDITISDNNLIYFDMDIFVDILSIYPISVDPIGN